MSEVIITPQPISAAALVAEIAYARLKEDPASTLGIATGSSPMRAYVAIGELVRSRSLDVSGVRGFGLDEYLGLAPDHPARYANVVRREIEPAIGLLPHSIQMPDDAHGSISEAADRFESRIRGAGGIDLQILGIGANGHIGFNEPGSSLASRTRVKTLAAPTRRDNSRFFSPREIVPTHCITQGIATIMDAQHLVLIACGAAKARAVHLALEGPVSASHPGSALQLHPHVTVVLDEAAASELRFRDYYDFAWHNKPDWQRDLLTKGNPARA